MYHDFDTCPHVVRGLERLQMASSLTVYTLPGGPLDTNAYLVHDPGDSAAMLLDAPPETHDAVVETVEEQQIDVQKIILTHAHWDHIVDANALKASLHAPIAAHPEADERLAKPGSAVMELPYRIALVQPDEHLDEGDDVFLGDHRFAVMHLPGHDPAHIVLYSETDKMLFGGDVVFPGGHGRTDIPGSDHEAMLRSLARLLDLPDDVTVYPGHGQPTTIGTERAWMRRLTRSI